MFVRLHWLRRNLLPPRPPVLRQCRSGRIAHFGKPFSAGEKEPSHQPIPVMRWRPSWPAYSAAAGFGFRPRFCGTLADGVAGLVLRAARPFWPSPIFCAIERRASE